MYEITDAILADDTVETSKFINDIFTNKNIAKTECKSWAFSKPETYDFKSTLTKLGLFCKQKLKAKTLHPSSSTVKSSTFTQIILQWWNFDFFGPNNFCC
jgi:hypothetical protein